jgi:hypothetical protein
MTGNRRVPWKQALCYTIERAIATYNWLEEQNREHQLRLSRKIDAVESGVRLRILCDVFSVYVTTLVSGGGNSSFSLKRNAPKLFKKVESLEVARKCKMNRHNRSAHEAESYGHFIYATDILESDIKNILYNLQLAIHMY